MALPVPFGFSAGDVIAVCILVKDVIKALDDIQGASSEFQQLSRELWSLDRALLEVEMLSRTCDTSVEPNTLSQTTKRVVDQCRECIELFLRKLKTYSRSLREGGSGDRVRDAGKKIKWILTQKEEIARFRTEINGHSSIINIKTTKLAERDISDQLLGAQGQRASIQHQQRASLSLIQEKLQENDRTLKENYFFKLGVELKTMMFSIWTINFKTYNAVMDLQTHLPREFKPCWIQEPLTLTDALGRVTPIHPELIGSWDVLQSVLVTRFDRLPGHKKIVRREHALRTHEANLEHYNDFTQPFESAFLPGRKFEMRLFFVASEDQEIDLCPTCRRVPYENFEIETKCLKCGTAYQRIRDRETPLPERLNADLYNDLVTKMRVNSKSKEGQEQTSLAGLIGKRKFGETAIGEDDIGEFRNVTLLYSNSLIHSDQTTFSPTQLYATAIESGKGRSKSDRVKARVFISMLSLLPPHAEASRRLVPGKVGL
ncbi:hypothetical protein VTL71DRAFT_2899 [Oculimacula yallundae]|uniref:Ubiquitin-like domain-containing protein n=1 Tax=Oculimacula yallundae TaxID=86028 RepID=A0ABR4C6C4_9HELO